MRSHSARTTCDASRAVATSSWLEFGNGLPPSVCMWASSPLAHVTIIRYRAFAGSGPGENDHGLLQLHSDVATIARPALFSRRSCGGAWRREGPYSGAQPRCRARAAAMQRGRYSERSVIAASLVRPARGGPRGPRSGDHRCARATSPSACRSGMPNPAARRGRSRAASALPWRVGGTIVREPLAEGDAAVHREVASCLMPWISRPCRLSALSLRR